MYQKCPICNGTGKQQNFDQTSKFSHCGTCAGTGIISSLTGLPPNYENVSMSTADISIDLTKYLPKT